ncbi:nitroreductase family protein [Lacticaseibacillus daqingensis]|uniref:nitroreductase family protein n=1 Tax=Lacticaseibacillus daqingensis TaxID=2486014 RepID=UPI0013DDBCFB|nr:nitroreductase family protein [Lacticaseibacillus daqingensis]
MPHRSIRQFTPAPVSAATLTLLEATAQATASSQFLQQFTLIRVADAAKRAAIAALTHCDFVAGPGVLYVFVVDQARNQRLLAAGVADRLRDWNAFLAGSFDATLAAQHVVDTAEALGLGTCYLGSILNDPQQMIDLLHLPRYTFPLLGLMVGHPATIPAGKPRLPQAAVVATDQYPAPVSLTAYDNTLRDYYEHRPEHPRSTDFTQLVNAYIKTDPHHRGEIGRILRQQGFRLD